jgi:hypothetical protein
MQAKRKVLAKHPEAKAVVLRRYPDMTPKYVAVFVGKRRLDIHDPGEEDRSWGGVRQGFVAAWRSANYALVREAWVKDIEQLAKSSGAL